MKTRKLKKRSLIIGVLLIFVASVFLGIVAGARGIGSLYPKLNVIAKPLVCPNGRMTFTQHVSRVGAANIYAPTWTCVDARTGTTKTLPPTSVYLAASPLYVIVIFAGLLLLIHVYWYSSVGPAKNDGLHLW
jgi:hypothetical protein